MCNCFLGEITKGSLKKNTVLFCSVCANLKDLEQLSKDFANISKDHNDHEFPDFLKDLLVGKIK
jgi:hypothetical protein